MVIQKKVKTTAAERPLKKANSKVAAAPAKKVAVGGKNAAKKVPVAGKKPLSPLEKARLAKAGGKPVARKTARPARKPLASWQAPADFKPHFIEIGVRTDKDGLLNNAIKATRYQGRYDPNAEDKKKFDVGSYDMATLVGVTARLAAVTFRANADRKYPADIKARMSTETFKNPAGEKKERLVYRAAHRLPANTTFLILLRVNKKSQCRREPQRT